jgi:hypothetical protein
MKGRILSHKRARRAFNRGNRYNKRNNLTETWRGGIRL